MAHAPWPGLGGKQLRYRDRTWELTGEVDVRESGDLLAVSATEVDDVRGETATLYFGIQDPPDSLNPGDLGEHFDRIDREGGAHVLVVKKEGKTYRYELRRLGYE